ncbi:DNA starvation/stationary phase protection protein [Paenibacillus sp. PK4536]|jgi:starvation-inducible DNA-binding protein|uniref:Nutrient stress-induced DNA-binding protein n=3 Tax=Paenibacillus TaxID=44249 RepID=A0A1E3L375_9BACL|nr:MULTISPECIES: DNA starvation/stationary phase protection protein [Paenibacillus]MDN4620188.1 DNA starvation/stationary phase protection protein [Paenibacillus sp. PsM32]ODP28262.1 Nutrient stress-induced DNA-binding protein [Paenibacillus nuruki]TKJ91096.1 DNA starvation/stationary phase protection protein [Paenibacillus sp. CFBP13512]WCT55547.1 DNA starvation/stationary phase protection protein [Paenibacillus kyungheensis]WDF51298.1 DNA starvation/stationary phase protection protein [Paeni
MTSLQNTSTTTETTQTTALYNALNVQIANWSLLYTKLHNFHWYVKGENFFTLHAKFEELYDQATVYMDDIAERLLAIGGQPVATLREQLELSTLLEATGTEQANQMVSSLVEDIATVSTELTETIVLAEQVSDQPTADLLIGIRGEIEKAAWMLNAYLGR